MCWATFWANISQTHLVTLGSGTDTKNPAQIVDSEEKNNFHFLIELAANHRQNYQIYFLVEPFKRST
jgi:hypothetical protein